jgi:hypothetical protein
LSSISSGQLWHFCMAACEFSWSAQGID